MTLKFLLISGLVFLIASSGCAVNDRGFVKVAHYETDTANVVSLEMCGILLITNKLDRGITIGCAKKAYFYGKFGIEPSHIDDQLIMQALDANEIVRPSKGRIESRDLGMPLALLSSGSGLLIDTNSHRAGFTLGYRSRQVIRLTKNFDGVFFASSNLSDIDLTHLFVYQGTK